LLRSALPSKEPGIKIQKDTYPTRAGRSHDGFQKMILNQLRLYTNRKIVDALNRAEDDDNTELLFALRMIMANVEQVATPDTLHPTPHTPHPRP
jgi:hypothetical protein